MNRFIDVDVSINRLREKMKHSPDEYIDYFLNLSNEIETEFHSQEAEQELFLKLPCKIGDFVYQIDMTNKVVRTQKVAKIEAVVLGKNERSFRIWFETAGGCCSFQFGKTVFFNKAEAIQVLDDVMQVIERKSSR